MREKRVITIIMGAAGRDFHNFNVYFRDNPDYDIVAFTANGTNKTARVCTQCLRSGAVQRVVRQRPFNLPSVEKAKAKS